VGRWKILKCNEDGWLESLSAQPTFLSRPEGGFASQEGSYLEGGGKRNLKGEDT
jgi:hypothetical protein